MQSTVNLKLQELKSWFNHHDSILIAFSGGVDSTLLAKVAFLSMGSNALAVTADSPSISRQDLANAKSLANLIGIDHIGIGSDLCKNWSDDIVMWMRNGKWTKTIDYGESKIKSTSWPQQPSWFKKGSDIINIYNGLLTSGMKEKNIYKILGSNWLNFMQRSFG